MGQNQSTAQQMWQQARCDENYIVNNALVTIFGTNLVRLRWFQDHDDALLDLFLDLYNCRVYSVDVVDPSFNAFFFFLSQKKSSHSYRLVPHVHDLKFANAFGYDLSQFHHKHHNDCDHACIAAFSLRRINFKSQIRDGFDWKAICHSDAYSQSQITSQHVYFARSAANVPQPAPSKQPSAS